MKRSLIAVCLLAGCATPETISGPGVTKAVNMPLVQFTATITLARDVARTCPSYAVSERKVSALLNARDLARFGPVAGNEIERDVQTRSFQAKHGVTVGADNTCAAIEAEIADESVIGVVMDPA